MRTKTWARAALAVALSAALVAGAGPTASAKKAEGTWTSLAPVPAPTEGISTANVGNLIVAAYGYSPTSGDTNLTRIYDIDADSWSLGSPAPGGGSSEGTAVSHGGSMYALGGRNGTQQQMNHRYTPETDTWEVLAPMPTGRTGLGAAVVGDSIYAVGGRTSTSPCSGGPLATVERYDILTDTWTTVAPLPTALSDIGVISHGGKIYVFGGCTVGTATASSEVYIYDPTTDTWTTGTDMPTPRASFYGVGIVGNNIYVMGGTDATGAPSPANEVYNIAHDSWTTSTPMAHPRGEMGVVSHGGRIYTVGGALPFGGSSQDTNDVFKP